VRRISRDTWLLLGLMFMIVLLTTLAIVSQTQERELPPLYSQSSQPNGAKALHLWLEELGFHTDNSLLASFEVPQETATTLVLQPTTAFSEGELETIDDWVQEGGTLILAGNSAPAILLARHYEFNLRFLPQQNRQLAAQSPLMASPPLNHPSQGNYTTGWQSDREDYVTHLAEMDVPAIISFEHGQGRVILSSSAYPFSNEGLKEAGNPQLVLNLLTSETDDENIWFNEWHHGLKATGPDISGPVDWLRQAPAGRGLLYTMVVVLVALALSGRSFGKPLRLPDDRRRRPPLEYITSLANLSRRAKHRRSVLDDYRYRLKRGLGRRYRLDPTLPNEQFVHQLAQLNSAIDSEALLTLLTRLSQVEVSEAELVELASETSFWLKEY
jgi:hypothetical protein